AKNVIPPPPQTLTKHTKLMQISGNRMISVITGDDLPHPFTDRGDGFMHPVAQFCLNQTQFRNHPLSYRLSPNDEGAILPSLPAIMRETQKGEGVRFSLSTLFSVLNCEPSELDQPCLFRMYFQSELGEPLLKCFQELLRICPVFKAGHQIIRISDD